LTVIWSGTASAACLSPKSSVSAEHLKILAQAGLVRAKRIKQWTFYKRDETAIRAVKREIQTRI
jgi:DNA-binding transcriptional ArsR family regulator